MEVRFSCRRGIHGAHKKWPLVDHSRHAMRGEEPLVSPDIHHAGSGYTVRTPSLHEYLTYEPHEYHPTYIM